VSDYNQKLSRPQPKMSSGIKPKSFNVEHLKTLYVTVKQFACINQSDHRDMSYSNSGSLPMKVPLRFFLYFVQPVAKF